MATSDLDDGDDAFEELSLVRPAALAVSRD